MHEGILVARDVTTSKDTHYLRYFDTLHQHDRPKSAIVEVAWGGAAGAYDDGGLVAVAATSNGDRRIDLTDTFVTVMQNAKSVADPAARPVGPRAVGARARVKPRACSTSVGDMYGDPFADAWPGFDPAHIGYVFTLRLRPGETRVADDVRREGAERGLRSARRLSDSVQGCADHRRGRRMPARTRRIPAAGIRDRARHRHRDASSATAPTCAA